jgi:hypothetical protein
MMLRENVRTGFFDHDQIAYVCQHLKDERAAVARFCFIGQAQLLGDLFPALVAIDLKNGLVVGAYPSQKLRPSGKWLSYRL